LTKAPLTVANGMNYRGQTTNFAKETKPTVLTGREFVKIGQNPDAIHDLPVRQRATPAQINGGHALAGGGGVQEEEDKDCGGMRILCS
jgi:hypothetical protein